MSMITFQEISTIIYVEHNLHLSEKEVYIHLEHIRQSIHAGGGHLEVTPAECRSCGFVFSKRGQLTPPGKCPLCRSETIFAPLFAIRKMSDA
jgi:transcriptional regulator